MNINGSCPDALSEHVANCQACLFAIAKQREPLAVSGCAGIRAIILALSSGGNSPLEQLHFTEEMMEDYHFRRLNRLERRVFEAHRASCDACATALHNELLFIYSMQAALQSDPHLFRNRSGAQFKSAAAA